MENVSRTSPRPLPRTLIQNTILRIIQVLAERIRLPTHTLEIRGIPRKAACKVFGVPAGLPAVQFFLAVGRDLVGKQVSGKRGTGSGMGTYDAWPGLRDERRDGWSGYGECAAWGGEG